MFKVELEGKCEQCNGHGYGYVDTNPDNYGWIDDVCAVCRGTGVAPSELGQELLAFVRKYLGKG